MSDRAIITAIQKMAGVFKKDTSYYVIAKVKSVEDEKCTVIIQSGEAELELTDVLLQAEVCDGLLITPKKDSNVLVCLSIYSPPYVSMFSDIDKYYLQVGDSADVVTNDGKRKFNDGSFGGLVKSVDPDNTQKGLLARLNKLENLLNEFINIYNTHTHTASSFGAPTTVPSSIETNTISPITSRSDIESDYITHGKKT